MQKLRYFSITLESKPGLKGESREAMAPGTQ